MINNRKIVKAYSVYHLRKKIASHEERNWKLISGILDHKYSTYVFCVMELQSFKVVQSNG